MNPLLRSPDTGGTADGWRVRKYGVHDRKAIMITTVALVLAWTSSFSTSQADEPSALWIEGESPTRSSTHRNPWFDSVDPAELSGGAQIANFSETNQPAGWAEYDVMVPTSDNYRFWVRANPCSGLLYALNGSSWAKLDTDAITKQDRAQQRTKGYISKAQQQTNVAADGTHDARFMTWYDLGNVSLPQGKNTIRFSLGGEQPGTKRFAALDCFVLTKRRFTPSFQYKPGESPGFLPTIKDEDSWAFAPKVDSFSSVALFDLRNLNENYAGEHGFIGLSSDGNSFVRGDGQPIRFWGATPYVPREARQRTDQAPCYTTPLPRKARREYRAPPLLCRAEAGRE